MMLSSAYILAVLVVALNDHVLSTCSIGVLILCTWKATQATGGDP